MDVELASRLDRTINLSMQRRPDHAAENRRAGLQSSLSTIARRFAQIRVSEYKSCYEFLVATPEVLEEEPTSFVKESQNALGFGDEIYAKQCLERALLLPDCQESNPTERARYFACLRNNRGSEFEDFVGDLEEAWARLKQCSAKAPPAVAANERTGRRATCSPMPSIAVPGVNKWTTPDLAARGLLHEDMHRMPRPSRESLDSEQSPYFHAPYQQFSKRDQHKPEKFGTQVINVWSPEVGEGGGYVPTVALLDSGASDNMVSKTFLEKTLKLGYQRSKVQVRSLGEDFELLGSVKLRLQPIRNDKNGIFMPEEDARLNFQVSDRPNVFGDVLLGREYIARSKQERGLAVLLNKRASKSRTAQVPEPIQEIAFYSEKPHDAAAYTQAFKKARPAANASSYPSTPPPNLRHPRGQLWVDVWSDTIRNSTRTIAVLDTRARGQHANLVSKRFLRQTLQLKYKKERSECKTLGSYFEVVGTVTLKVFALDQKDGNIVINEPDYVKFHVCGDPGDLFADLLLGLAYIEKREEESFLPFTVKDKKMKTPLEELGENAERARRREIGQAVAAANGNSLSNTFSNQGIIVNQTSRHGPNR